MADYQVRSPPGARVHDHALDGAEPPVRTQNLGAEANLQLPLQRHRAPRARFACSVLRPDELGVVTGHRSPPQQHDVPAAGHALIVGPPTSSMCTFV